MPTRRRQRQRGGTAFNHIRLGIHIGAATPFSTARRQGSVGAGKAIASPRNQSAKKTKQQRADTLKSIKGEIRFMLQENRSYGEGLCVASVSSRAKKSRPKSSGLTSVHSFRWTWQASIPNCCLFSRSTTKTYCQKSAKKLGAEWLFGRVSSRLWASAAWVCAVVLVTLAIAILIAV